MRPPSGPDLRAGRDRGIPCSRRRLHDAPGGRLEFPTLSPRPMADRGAVGFSHAFAPGPRACPDGQERLRQVDAGEDPGRGGPADFRHAAGQRRRRRLRTRPPTPSRRHRHRAPGAVAGARRCRSARTSSSAGCRSTRKLGVAVVDWQRLHRRGRGAPARDGARHRTRGGWPRPSASASSRWSRSSRRCRFAPSVLLLDEPTSALAHTRGRACCSRWSAGCKARGVTMIYITHRMNELFEIADTCTVLRDGRSVGSIEMARPPPGLIVEMMFGDVAHAAAAAARPSTAPARRCSSVRGLTRRGSVRRRLLRLYPGEILGHRRAARRRPHRGAARRSSAPIRSMPGTVTLDGKRLAGPAYAQGDEGAAAWATRPKTARRSGWCRCCPPTTISVSPASRGIAPRGLITRGEEGPFVTRQIGGSAHQGAEPMLPVASLSGGNQQKVVIGNWLNTEPEGDVLRRAEPRRRRAGQAARSSTSSGARPSRGCRRSSSRPSSRSCSRSPTASW